MVCTVKIPVMVGLGGMVIGVVVKLVAAGAKLSSIGWTLGVTTSKVPAVVSFVGPEPAWRWIGAPRGCVSSR